MLTSGIVESVDGVYKGVTRKPTRREVYFQRKADGLCTRCGEPAADGLQLCLAHHNAQIASNRKTQRRLRAERRKRGECSQCSAKSETYWCRGCTLRWRTRGVYNTVTNSDERTWKDSTGRNRYHGKTARGRQPTSVLDTQDLKLMTQTFDRARARLTAFHDLPPDITTTQREQVRMSALDDFAYLVRLLEDDFLERHRYEERRTRANSRMLDR